MSAPEIDPLLASEITRQKEIAINDSARWGRMFMACSIASVVFGVGAWFLLEPMDRDWGTACGACGFAAVTWLIGLCLLSLFGSHRTPKCPQCGFSWEQEGSAWPTWKHCPGCGLKMNDDTGSQGKPLTRALYHEPTKYVPKLRSLKTDTNPLLIKCNMDAGHGGASGRYEALREKAYQYAFLLDQMGVKK